ncbi:hypothetical protein EBX93_08940, partial [bacterium]|nr:hypothetical protein [bacterium]
IAASTAFPPDLSIARPASDPGCETETTTPFLNGSAADKKLVARISKIIDLKKDMFFMGYLTLD